MRQKGTKNTLRDGDYKCSLNQDAFVKGHGISGRKRYAYLYLPTNKIYYSIKECRIAEGGLSQWKVTHNTKRVPITWFDNKYKRRDIKGERDLSDGQCVPLRGASNNGNNISNE